MSNIRHLPLKHLKVLDFTSLLPGPYATQMLSDLGSSVLRVESLHRVDLAKITPPFVRDGISAIHAQLNRDKRAIALDLKSPNGRSAVVELIRDHGYDVLVEGFRPGVMSKLGLGFEDLRRENPDLIYVSITGYGQKGPYSQRAGHDINYLALSGLASYGQAEPSLHATQIADIAGGSHHGVIGLLAAVVQRQAVIANRNNIKNKDRDGDTGSIGGMMVRPEDAAGTHVDVSMAAAAFGLNCMGAASALYTGEAPLAGEGVLTGGIETYGYYETSDGRWMSVGALEPQFAAAFFAAIERPELAQKLAGAMRTSRNSTGDDSDDDRDSLRSEIAAVLRGKTQEEWIQVFRDLDCCVEPVLDVLEASRHPAFGGMVTKVPIQEAGTESVSQLSMASIKFAGRQQREHKFAGVTTGAHTQEVLEDTLGREVR